MTDEELRLECLKSASYLMSHKPMTVFNKETLRAVDSPTVLADIYSHYVKTGSLTYLNEQDITAFSEARCKEHSDKELEEHRDKLIRSFVSYESKFGIFMRHDILWFAMWGCVGCTIATVIGIILRLIFG